MQRDRTTSRRGFTSIGSMIIVGLVFGLIIIMLATPSIRAVIIRRNITHANSLLQAGDTPHAIQLLQQVKPWADCYPALAAELNQRLVRAYAAGGHLDQAIATAETIRKPAQPTDSATSTWAPIQLLEIAPNRLFNSIYPAPTDMGMEGYNILLDTLTGMNRTDLLLNIDHAVKPGPSQPTGPPKLVPSDKHIDMATLVPDDSPHANAVAPSPKITATNIAAPVQANATSPAEQSPPVTDPSRDIALKIIQLRAQQKILLDQLVTQKKNAPPDTQEVKPARTAAIERLRKARQKYNDFVDGNIKLKQEWDRSHGPRRAFLFDELKKRKFEEPDLKLELDKAEAAMKASGGNSQDEARKAHDRVIREIEQQLQSVRATLQTLEFQARTGPSI